MESVCFFTRERAALLGKYPNSLIAWSTFAFVLGETLSDPLTTRETVVRETPE